MNRTDSHDAMIAAGLNLIQQAMSIFDSDLQLVLINRPMQQMFNLPNMLVQPGTSFEYVIRYLAERGEYGEIDDLESFVSNRVELARNFEAHYMERTRANGRVISVEGAPLPEGGWVTVYTDITDLKQSEKARREKALEQKTRLLQRTVDSLSQGVAVVNDEGALEVWNGRFLELAGLAVSKGQESWWLTALHTSFRIAKGWSALNFSAFTMPPGCGLKSYSLYPSENQ